MGLFSGIGKAIKSIAGGVLGTVANIATGGLFGIGMNIFNALRSGQGFGGIINSVVGGLFQASPLSQLTSSSGLNNMYGIGRAAQDTREFERLTAETARQRFLASNALDGRAYADIMRANQQQLAMEGIARLVGGANGMIGTPFVPPGYV